MSLIDLAKSNPSSFESYRARQIVAFAGDGHLRDGSECSDQLRAYLRTANSGRLESYARECLEQGFTDSGLVLQDVVNELGRRLEFDVENGRYRGVTNAIGFDGVWRVPAGPTIVIEVKTTDTYNVSLDVVAQYRLQLIAQGKIDSETSVLFIVGLKDTGALEAQIRGSRHAWSMRVVGVDSLLKLVRVKQHSTEDQTINQIRELLRPFEYTRVDRILDVVFSAARDAVQSEDDAPAVTGTSESTSDLQQNRTPQEILEDVRARAADALNHKVGANLVRMRQALFEDVAGQVRACVTVSKRYDDRLQPYWYAYHPKWDEFLSHYPNGYMVFACVDRDEAFAVPVAAMRTFLPSLNETVRADGASYWHVKFAEDSAGMVLFCSKTGERFDLKPYQIVLAP